MSAKGKVRETFEDQLYAGLVKVKSVLGVNPTVEERAKFYGRELTENEKENPDIDYTGETTEGDKKITLVFYLELDHPIVKVQKYRLELVDKVRRDKNGVKFQIVNQTGDTSFVPPTDNDEPDYNDALPWFANFQNKEKEDIAPKKMRPALVGEEQLMVFLKATLGLDYSDPDTELTYNYDNFFKGDVSELEGDFRNDALRKEFVAGIDVTKSKDGDKFYQNIYGKRFLPADTLKYITNLNFPSKFLRNQFTKFKEEVEGEYGTKGYLPLAKLDVYDPKNDDVNMEGNIASEKTVSSKYD